MAAGTGALVVGEGKTPSSGRVPGRAAGFTGGCNVRCEGEEIQG